MNTEITLNGITVILLMGQKPTYLENRGWIHPAQLMGNFHHDCLSSLVGETLWGSVILSVKCFATSNQNNRYIGILLDSKKW